MAKKSDNSAEKTKVAIEKPKHETWVINVGIGKEKEYLIENISLLLSSGISIISTLRSIKKEVSSPRLKKIISRAEEDIEAGYSLGEALENTRLFSTNIIALIRIGESSGRLSENLQLIAIQQEKDRLFTSKIRSAMMYPVLIMGIASIVGVSIAWFILPRLASVFKDLHLTLPLITRLLIRFGTFLGEHGAYAVPIFFVVMTSVLYFLFVARKTRHIGQYILMHLPGFGQLIRQVELGRTGHVLATLLDAGIPIVDAMYSLEEGTTLTPYKRMYRYWRIQIEEGDSFHMMFDAYKKTGKLIPGPIQQMIIAGEQSGHLALIFHKIGEMYEGKTESTMKNVSVLLEPLLLFIVWIGVVGVALAVILPIYSLIGGLN